MNLSLSKPQADFLANSATVAAFWGGLGSGKTFIGTLWASLYAIQNQGCLMLVGANTPAQLHAVVIPMLRKHLQDLGVEHYLGERPPWNSRFSSHSNVLSLEGGTQILLRSMYESGADRGLRGIEVSGVYFDEAREVEEDVLDLILGRLRAKGSPIRLRMTSTPNGKRGWLYKRFISSPPPDWAVVRATTMSNQPNLPPGYVERLKETYGTEQYNQEVLGNWVDMQEGLAYRFDRGKHCARKPCQGDQPIFFSLDLNVSPMIGVVAQWDERARTMHFLEEIIIRDNAQTKNACQIVADRYSHKVNQALYMCDEAGSARSTRTTESDVLIMQEMMPRLFRSARSMNGSGKPRVVDRVNAFNAMLDPVDGPPRLTIDPSCGELIADLETLSWDQYGKIDKSDPKRSHAADAAGYAVHRLYPIGGGSRAFGLDGSLDQPAKQRNIQAGFPAPVGA
jgi:phage terminase large subunit-like protein